MKAILTAWLLTIAVSGQRPTTNDQRPAPPSVHDLAEKVDRHYNALQTLRCDFTENYIGNGIQRSESGTLELKKPGRMRWDYQQPRPKLFLSDGKTAWFYVPGDHQARKSPAKDLEDLRSPLRYLLGKTKLEKELDVLAFAPDVKPIDAGDVVLRGRPKFMADQVEDVVLEVNNSGQIRRLTIHETDGSTTQFSFSNIKENAPIADTTFHFAPPVGVEVITSKDIAPQ